jgi:SAM-dependent methyltransferase
MQALPQDLTPGGHMAVTFAKPDEILFFKAQLDRVALPKATRAFSDGTLTENLADQIAARIGVCFDGKSITGLHVGCDDMALAQAIAERRPETAWIGIDTHEVSPRDQLEALEAYRSFNGRTVPFERDSFDVVVITDLLHHTPVEHQSQLLAECARVCRGVVIVKELMEDGPFSRLMLRVLDMTAARGWPSSYFTNKQFSGLARAAGLKELNRTTGMELYPESSVMSALVRPEWQMISVLTPYR